LSTRVRATPRGPAPLGLGVTDIGPYKNAIPMAVGGMAEVFRALRSQPAGADRAVVIKRLLPELLEDPEQRAMFEHEAQLGRAVRHPNVVEVLDAAGGDAPYLVLEYVFGVDLSQLVRWAMRAHEPLSTELAAFIAAELCAGLAAVHGAIGADGAPLAIVHRDVSPSNVFLSVHGDVKLGDLGIARALGEGARGRERAPFGQRSERAKGKLGYIAPEQIQGTVIDSRADVFAAAVIAAELLLGRPLFSAPTELGVLLAIRDADVSPLVTSPVPIDIVAVLVPALARDRARRTASAAELGKALSAFVTTPVATLRKQLGRWVVRAMDSVERGADRISLAATIESDGRRLPSPSPAHGVARVGSRTSDRPAVDTSGPSYEVHAANAHHSSWPFARVVQALRTGEISGDATIAVDGGQRRPVALVSELARHLPGSARTPATKTPASALALGEPRSLANDGLLTLLASAWREAATGVIVCERGATRKEILLESGVATFITSNQAEDLLGEQLLRAGVIGRDELELALAVLPRHGGRLGDSLVALGLVEPLVLFRHIAKQVREKLLEVFTWPDGRAVLHPGMELPERSFPVDLTPFELLERGAERRIAAGLEPAARFEKRLLALVPTRERVVELPPHAEEIVEVVRTPRSLDELRVHADLARTRAVVTVLLALGVLRLT
jgi:serine/threonine protein kinase